MGIGFEDNREREGTWRGSKIRQHLMRFVLFQSLQGVPNNLIYKNSVNNIGSHSIG
jgi:hypothetical protein